MSEDNAFLGGFLTGTGVFVLLLLVKRYLWCLRRSRRIADAPNAREFSTTNPYVLTLIVRTDIPLVKSKMARHCSHASVLAFDNLLSKDPQAARFWLYNGQSMIILAADTLNVIIRMDDLARRLDLLTTFVCEDRRSLVGPPTVTVLGIGPAPLNVVNRITHDLRIL